MKRTLLAAAAILAFGLAAPASAQTTSSTSGAEHHRSDAERDWYRDNSTMLTPFFTDESMGTLRTNDEVAAAFAAMNADDRAAMKTACERAAQQPGQYGSVTDALCAQAGMANTTN